MKSILYVTDLYYEAKGRMYYDEDLFLTGELRKEFPMVLCHPQDMEYFEPHHDLIVFRNAGPTAGFKDKYWAFRKRIVENHLNTYNSFNGHGDMDGKDYLLELTKLNYPLIPTINRLAEFALLPETKRYVTKPKDGADSNGMAFLSKEEVFASVDPEDRMTLIQPWIDFQYEVSFYFIDRDFQYALYAPDKARRWELVRYEPTQEDIDFALTFIDWNGLDWGIQRVDACRDENGRLLLVELEDLNPYLSLLGLEEGTRKRFVERFKLSLHKALGQK